jgi:glycosyltransferase involved in cell wall biosynthesis
MTESPLVSVIIPTYNRSDVVCRAIDSALTQTYKKLEVIVVDDGSTDETPATLKRYGDRIVSLVQQNAGPSVARNVGIRRSKGDIIAFLDSDDYWLPTKIEKQVALLKCAGEHVVCCLCNCATVYSDGSRTSTFAVADVQPHCDTGVWLNPAEVLTTRFVIFSQAVAVRRKFLESAGGYDENLPFFCEDHELALRLALQGPWAIIREELVVCQGAGPGSLGEQARRQQVRLHTDLLYMWTRMTSCIESHPSRPELSRLARRELSGTRRALAIARIENKGFPGAIAMGRVLRFIERLRRGVFRRTSAYPHLSVEELSV